VTQDLTDQKLIRISAEAKEALDELTMFYPNRTTQKEIVSGLIIKKLKEKRKK
jgi:hypothetical protein